MKKYRLPFLILTVIVFTYMTVHSFYKFSIGIDKGMSLIGGIVFGVMTIVYVFYLLEFNKKKKRINS